MVGSTLLDVDVHPGGTGANAHLPAQGSRSPDRAGCTDQSSPVWQNGLPRSQRVDFIRHAGSLGVLFACKNLHDSRCGSGSM